MDVLLESDLDCEFGVAWIAQATSIWQPASLSDPDLMFSAPLIYGTTLTVTQAELHDGKGASVALYPNPQNCANDCYAMIPVAPLQGSTTYTVHAAGTVDGTPFDITWSFTTR